MRFVIAYVLFPVLSYLLGSISFGLIVARIRKVDLRQHGSGNIGATNVFRALGRGPAIAVFALDFLKGAAPALGFALIAQAITGLPSWKMLGIVYGAFAIFGHIYPIFHELRGGKAVATSCGVFICLAPLQTLTALMIWAVVLLFGKYVSLASLSAAVSLVLLVLIFYPPAKDVPEKWVMLLFAGLAAAVIIYRHRENIKRLRAGTEPKLLTSREDVRALEAEKKHGKERLARAGKTPSRRSVEALRKISRPKPAEGELKPAEAAASGEAAESASPDGKVPGSAEAASDEAASGKPASAAASAPEDQLDTAVPSEDLEEVGTEAVEPILNGSAEDSDKTETRTEGGNDSSTTPAPKDQPDKDGGDSKNGTSH